MYVYCIGVQNTNFKTNVKLKSIFNIYLFIYVDTIKRKSCFFQQDNEDTQNFLRLNIKSRLYIKNMSLL